MKAHHRKKREAGGVAEYKEDLKSKPEMRVNATKIKGEAEERKRGGKAVKMHGAKGKHHAGRMPRKSGGRAGSNMNPLSSAHSGTPAKGRHTVSID
jgi:hypothetical protein